MVTLNGVTLNVIEDTPIEEAEIKRNSIAGTARTSNHNLGKKNIRWDLNCWVKTEADYKVVSGLVGIENIEFVDKYGDTYNVDVTRFAGPRKPHDRVAFRLSLEEHS